MNVTLASTGSAEFMAVLQRLGQPLQRQALAATVADVEEVAGELAGLHTKTGALFASLYAKPVSSDGDVWEIGHDLQRAPHALFVHWGTKPHVIRPKKKKVLRWAGGGAGGFAFAREVHHPGYAGDPWLVTAAARAPAIFERHVRARIAQTMGT